MLDEINMPNVELEYENLYGLASLNGPVIRFQLSVRAQFSSGEPDSVMFGVRGGDLSLQTKMGSVKVGSLTPAIQNHVARIYKGGTNQSITLEIQLSPASIRRLLDEAGDRIFQITVDATATIPTDPSSFDPRRLLDLLAPWGVMVGGKINGARNVQAFQIDSDSWKRAIESTRSADYLTDTILVTNTEREYVKTLYSAIKEAENFLNEGKIEQAIAKTRSICEWAGRKAQNQEDKYPKIRQFEFDQKERDNFKGILEALWNWASVGHHNDLSGNVVFTEEQARMSIHLAYDILYYLSNKQMTGSS